MSLLWPFGSSSVVSVILPAFHPVNPVAVSGLLSGQVVNLLVVLLYIEKTRKAITMPTTKAANSKSGKNSLSPKHREELLRTLQARFEKHRHRHEGLEWLEIQAKLEASPEKLWSLSEMERTGGEPDVVGRDKKTGKFIFCDCSAESPKGRRSLCYDREALESRRQRKPNNNALDTAAAMGIELLTEDQYREYKDLERSTRKPRAGSEHLRKSENSGAPSFVIAVTTLCSSITTARSLTMPPEPSGLAQGLKLGTGASTKVQSKVTCHA